MTTEKWLLLKGVESQYHPKATKNLTDFGSQENCRFVQGDRQNIDVVLPLTISKEDTEFFMSGVRFDSKVKSYKLPGKDSVLAPTWRISRGSDKYICLVPGGEGIVFDQNGIFKNGGFLNTIKTFPRWLKKIDEDYFVDIDFLSQKPKYTGSFIVFFDGNVHNYKHWWVDMLSLLDVARRRAGLSGFCLLPSAIHRLREWQQDSLRLMDQGDLFSPDAGVDVMRVNEAIWIDILDPFPFFYDELKSMRDIATAGLDSRSVSKKKIYIKRLNKLRSIRNEAEIDTVLLARGFEVAVLERMSQREQIGLFAEAEIIVGNHGAGFTNMLFSHPGTKILEFMPSAEMRVHYWGMAQALGHEYGFLRSESKTSRFHDAICVDARNLEILLERFGY